jgi:hypothetical protein
MQRRKSDMAPVPETCTLHETIIRHQDERDARNNEDHSEMFRQLRALSNKLNLILGILVALQVVIVAAATFFARH